MYQPDDRYGGWGHLGGEDEIDYLLESEDESIISYNLQQGVDNSTELPYHNKGSLNNMTKQEELLLIDQAQSGSAYAKQQITKKYELLCHKIARKFGFTAPNADHDDLFQEAQIGLLKAIESYDVTKGASFMTWAYYAVRGAVVSSGKSDRKQPRYPISLESSQRAYNVEDDRVYTVREDFPEGLIHKLVEDCCGGMHTKRAKIVMDRFGLLGRTELRNCEAARKYGISKNAIVSHTYNFKKKVRARYPELEMYV
jgi:RNA polymerase sigma factor (sigma-70 family)